MAKYDPYPTVAEKRQAIHDLMQEIQAGAGRPWRIESIRQLEEEIAAIEAAPHIVAPLSSPAYD